MCLVRRAPDERVHGYTACCEIALVSRLVFPLVYTHGVASWYRRILFGPCPTSFDDGVMTCNTLDYLTERLLTISRDVFAGYRREEFRVKV